MNPIILYKKEGETPLECINRSKEEGAIPKDVKATYAGRLDPMAEGLLIVLVGEAVHEKEKYLKLSKEYEVEVLLGMSTDTGDVLGEIQDTKPFFMSGNSLSLRVSSQLDKDQSVVTPDIKEFPNDDMLEYGEQNVTQKIQDVLKNCVGEFEEEYPKYSSRTVGGKPLFSLARLGHIFKSPKHKVVINSIILQNTRMMKVAEVADESIERIKKVKGDFRQEEIIEGWEKLKDTNGEDKALVVSIKVSCESGAYMRVLAEKIGKSLVYPALALRIKRTKVGEYTI